MHFRIQTSLLDEYIRVLNENVNETSFTIPIQLLTRENGDAPLKIIGCKDVILEKEFIGNGYVFSIQMDGGHYFIDWKTELWGTEDTQMNYFCEEHRVTFTERKYNKPNEYIVFMWSASKLAIAS